MRYRLFFLVVTLFFITMNVLLWHTEIAGRNHLIGGLPAEVVWDKVLTAPDNSSLTIERRGVKIGHCTWIPNLGEERATGKQPSDEPLPEGMVNQLAGYTLDLDGQLSLDDLTRLRFNLTLKLATNQALQEIVAALKIRPDSWEVRAVLASQSVQLRKEEDGVVSKKVFQLSQPSQVEALLRDMGVPLPPGTLATLGLPFGQSHPAATSSLGLAWEARQDWLKLAHSRLRVYRLQTRLLDRYKADIYVSHVGEILRVELPQQIVLKNDALLELE